MSVPFPSVPFPRAPAVGFQEVIHNSNGNRMIHVISRNSHARAALVRVDRINNPVTHIVIKECEGLELGRKTEIRLSDAVNTALIVIIAVLANDVGAEKGGHFATDDSAKNIQVLAARR